MQETVRPWPKVPATGRATLQAIGRQTVPGQAAPRNLGLDQLQLSVSLSDLRAQVTLAEKLMGKKVSFKSEHELDAYLTSVQQALPQNRYDRNGFLAGTLGMTGIHSAGREDRPTVTAVGQIASYRPKDQLWGHNILPQQLAFDLAKASPSLFLLVTKVTNPLMEAISWMRGKWKHPYESKQQAVPTGETAFQHYPTAYSYQVGRLGFDQDFHSGIPDNGPHGTLYGTYSIALSLGFSDEQAKRLARMDNGVDDNTTPYGSTSPYLFGQMDRHFNFNRDGQDTRLIWAERHLKAAIALGKQTAYDQAEVELGIGLHSLQDLFAHGQLTPSVHAVLGEFPDNVTYDPIAFVEATKATQAYLKVYLKAIAPQR